MPKDETHEIAVDRSQLLEKCTKSERRGMHADLKRIVCKTVILATPHSSQGRFFVGKNPNYSPQGRFIMIQPTILSAERKHNPHYIRYHETCFAIHRVILPDWMNQLPVKSGASSAPSLTPVRAAA